MSKQLLVGGVETFSMVDYPGQMAAVVFLQGCPWRCPFCHNTDLQIIGKDNGFSWPKFMEFLEERKGKLDAVVFSGGEPLVQDALEDAVKEVKALGYKIGLHTGGFRPDFFKRLLPLLDWVGFDIKTPLTAERYNAAIGQKHFEKALESLRALVSSGVAFECRTTCDPRLLSIEDIYTLGRRLPELGVKEYYLQQYRPIPSDTVSTEADCEKFFENEELIAFLKKAFPVFDVRK